MNLTIDHRSKLPLHVQVETLLRDLIVSPQFGNGELLPKEVELANRLDVLETLFVRPLINWSMKDC
jgi:GntR family transcriptional regulator